MENLVLEQDPKSVNIKPVKQEVETEAELNRHGFSKQRRRMLLCLKYASYGVLPYNFFLSPGGCMSY